MLKLIIEHSATSVWVVDKSFTIGSAADNHLVLEQFKIAEHHARIQFDGKKHMLRDLGTEAGTYVNEQRITQRPIYNLDVIRLGDLCLKVLDPLYPGNQQQWCLVGSANWLAGQAFTLPFSTGKNTLKVGRGVSCDVIFPGVHLSKEHIELTLVDHQIHLRNLNIANAIYVNDRPLTDTCQLNPGDELRLDICVFQLFGPIGQPNSTSPSIPPQRVASPFLPAQSSSTTDSAAKRWKTRPTSPGNREEQNQSPSPMDSLMLKIAVAAAVMGLIVLGTYIWLA